MFQLQIFGIILFVQDSIFSLPFVSLLFLATRAENLVVKYGHKSRDKESPKKRKKVEHRAFSHSGAANAAAAPGAAFSVAPGAATNAQLELALNAYRQCATLRGFAR